MKQKLIEMPILLMTAIVNNNPLIAPNFKKRRSGAKQLVIIPVLVKK